MEYREGPLAEPRRGLMIYAADFSIEDLYVPPAARLFIFARTESAC
jgi:hypothetical protein